MIKTFGRVRARVRVRDNISSMVFYGAWQWQ